MPTSFGHSEARLLHFVTWAVRRGIRLFQRVHVKSAGLFAVKSIPKYDFAALVPSSAILSPLSLQTLCDFPLQVTPTNFATTLDWWPDLNWGSFCFIAMLAQAWVTGNPAGIQSYLDILPVNPAVRVGTVADNAQRTKEYRQVVAPLLRASSTSLSNFNVAFRHAYCLFRRHAIPLWSGERGHPLLLSTEFSRGDGEIFGMTPLVDLAVHSATPNAVVGTPDSEMLKWLAEKGDVSVDGFYFVLQALRDIQVGEVLTVNKNDLFHFDSPTFEACFGFPYR